MISPLARFSHIYAVCALTGLLFSACTTTDTNLETAEAEAPPIAPRTADLRNPSVARAVCNRPERVAAAGDDDFSYDEVILRTGQAPPNDIVNVNCRDVLGLEPSSRPVMTSSEPPPPLPPNMVGVEIAPSPLGAAVGAIPKEERGPITSYIVSTGDTLSSIAAERCVSWQDLASLNGLSKPYTLRVGMELQLPEAGC